MIFFQKSELFLAFRYLRAKRREERFISIIAGFSFTAICLGVATLIIVMSVMNGFRQKLLGKILDFNSHATLYMAGDFLPDYNEIIQKLKTIPHVKEGTPIIERQAMVTANGQASGIIVRGIDQKDLEKRTVVADHILSGSLAAFSGASILLGRRLADNLKVEVGDFVNLIIPQGNRTPFGVMPRSKTYQVSGIFDAGMSEYNKGFGFIPLPSAQTFFNMGPTVNSIEVFFDSPEDADTKTQYIQEAFQDTPLRIVDWQQNNSSFFEAVMVERNVMFIILTLIIIVAAFNIISCLIILVRTKTRDIAILRTMGATKASIIKIFFIVGSSIGVLGTIGGVVLGLLFTYNIDTIRQGLQSLLGMQLFSPEIYFLSKLPAIVEPKEVMIVVLMALFWTFLATLIPAWKAADLDPIQGLRHE
jgi:lipoprotein-releasing system permease protein